MSKPSTLESLLAAFDRTEQLRADTEGLKPRLENEINQALATGDVLDESLAAGLQTKRGQLELIGPKLAQISAKADELVAAIQDAFQSRYVAFTREIRLLQDATLKRILSLFYQLGVGAEDAESIALQGVWGRTKMAKLLTDLDSAIRFQVSQRNIVGAARELLRREEELAAIKKLPENKEALPTLEQKS
ncbi:MAG: hypothetical protein ABSA45_10750 [Verrucomicrobiota bacterium]|jgi:hypothetical protein